MNLFNVSGIITAFSPYLTSYLKKEGMKPNDFRAVGVGYVEPLTDVLSFFLDGGLTILGPRDKRAPDFVKFEDINPLEKDLKGIDALILIDQQVPGIIERVSKAGVQIIISAPCLKNSKPYILEERICLRKKDLCFYRKG